MKIKYTFNNGILEIQKCPKVFDEKIFKDIVTNLHRDKIKEVRFPNYVTKIEGTFLLSVALEKIILPKNLKTLGDGVFKGCPFIEEIEIPEKVRFIGEKVFSDCDELKKIKMPKKLKSIGSVCFEECVSLEEIVVPKGIKTLGEYGFFDYCKKLKKVTLPSTLKEICRSCFSGCESLEEIEIPEGVTKIDNNAFRTCKNLKKVVLPSTLKTIGNNCFDNCSSLEEIVLPKGVENLVTSAFERCSELKKIVLPSTLKTIDAECFSECSSLGEIVIPEGVTSIDSRAFYNCRKLKKITLPSSLKTIGNDCFDNCLSLEEIVIPEGVTSIDSRAFYNCRKLKKITLPSSLKTLGNNCFENCLSLEEIVIPEGVEVLTRRLFSCCENLKKITLPSTLKRIDEECFSFCKSLEEIEIPEGVEIISNAAFNMCKNLKRIVIPSTVRNIGRGCFSNCSLLEKVSLPEGMETIEGYVFCDCKNLKQINLPSTIKEIKDSAFSTCSSLENIVINEGVKTIRMRAFDKCSNLKTIVLPSTLKTIENDCFFGCEKIENISIPIDCQVSQEAFNSCGIETLVVKENYNKMNIFSFFATSIDSIVYEGENNTVRVDAKNKVIVPSKIMGVITQENLHNPNDKTIGYFYKGKYIEFDEDKLIQAKANEINKIENLKETGVGATALLHLWASKGKFIPHYTVIQNMPVEDIDSFYKNNNAKKWGEIVKLAPSIKDYNKGTLFKICYALGVFQESGSKRDEAIEFIKEHVISKMDEFEIHAKFDAFDTFNHKYDPMWAEFFMKHFKENSDFMTFNTGWKTVDLLAASYNNFDKVKQSYPNKVVNTNREADMLHVSHVKNAVQGEHYSNVHEDNREFALEVGVYGYTQAQFEMLQEWFDEGKKIQEKDLKIFISNDKEDKNSITYELLAKDNPLGAVVGNVTNCCQVLGGAGASCVKYGMTMPNSKFITFNYNKEILGQAWVWYDEKLGVICLDNIEVPTRYIDKIKHNKELQEKFVECLKRMADNFISEMKNHGLKVKKVTVGKGYNDIKEILSKDFQTDYKPSVLSDYNGYTDASKQYIIKKK